MNSNNNNQNNNILNVFLPTASNSLRSSPVMMLNMLSSSPKGGMEQEMILISDMMFSAA